MWRPDEADGERQTDQEPGEDARVLAAARHAGALPLLGTVIRDAGSPSGAKIRETTRSSR